MRKRTFLCSDEYLHIPVSLDGERQILQVWFGGRLLHEFYATLSPNPNCPRFFLSIKPFSQKELVLILPDAPSDDNSLEAILVGGAPEMEHTLYPDLYREALRPQFHFSSRRGWLNDPNGLFYADGLFHLYYQHNPLGTSHGGVNICWGHAVSTDLLHWQEQDDAMLPWRKDWMIASGSALLDTEGVAGYGENAVIASFTALGTCIPESNDCNPSGGQYMAASLDGGDSFYLFSGEATVPTENGEGWRDPRLFRYGDHYMMAVYETENGRNCVSFYKSSDLHHWERTSRNPDLFECPDIFSLTLDGVEKWVLYGADGLARIGNFDGEIFTESGRAHPLDYGTATYAGQTWNHHPNNKRIHISWVRNMDGQGEGFQGMPFSQCMTLPCEVSLRGSPDGLRVCRTPVEETALLREGTAEQFSERLEGEFALRAVPGTEYHFRISDLSERLEIYVGCNSMTFDPISRQLSFQGGQVCTLNATVLDFRLFADTTTLELYFADGIAATYSMMPDSMRLKFKGKAVIEQTVWKLRSIWNGN